MRSMLFLLGLLLSTTATVQGEALDEVNLQRARLGLPPLARDEALTRFAQKKAEWQAARGIHLWNGHNGHEGPRSGASEGTGCARRGIGWISCRMDTVGQWSAGAGVAWGPDGYRYHCLVINCPQSTPSHRRSETFPIVATFHLTPEAPRVAARPRVPREPMTWHTPIVYRFDGESDSPGSGGNLQRVASGVCPRCGRIH